jgi:hypothetical protein
MLPEIGEKVSSDPTGYWQRRAMEMTREVMEKSGRYTVQREELNKTKTLWCY